MVKGWIKLHRDIIEHWVFEDPLLLKTWILLIAKANHEDKKIMINGKHLTVHRGQFWTSIRKLSGALNMGINTVHRKLDALQNDGMIFMDTYKGIGTLITVRNYATYQDFQTNKNEDSGYTNGYTNGYAGGDKSGTPPDTLMDHKQELKNYISTNKALKNNGLPPDHPDYFEEI